MNEEEVWWALHTGEGDCHSRSALLQGWIGIEGRRLVVSSLSTDRETIDLARLVDLLKDRRAAAQLYAFVGLMNEADRIVLLQDNRPLWLGSVEQTKQCRFIDGNSKRTEEFLVRKVRWDEQMEGTNEEFRLVDLLHNEQKWQGERLKDEVQKQLSEMFSEKYTRGEIPNIEALSVARTVQVSCDNQPFAGVDLWLKKMEKRANWAYLQGLLRTDLRLVDSDTDVQRVSSSAKQEHVDTSQVSTPDMRRMFLSKMPMVYEQLLADRTTHNKIIWANETHQPLDPERYKATAEVDIQAILDDVIVPRFAKSKADQQGRTKSNAEVFTPLWVIEKQNDTLDKEDLDLRTYIEQTWLEVACGEGPYMVTRYHMDSGKQIPLGERTGFVDRKLQRINQEATNIEEWRELVRSAFKSSYGFEKNGDSLLLARENLLCSYWDYHCHKWNDVPSVEEVTVIAKIISYNIFQMDGLTKTVPLSDRTASQVVKQAAESRKPTNRGIPVQVMNWKTGQMERF